MKNLSFQGKACYVILLILGTLIQPLKAQEFLFQYLNQAEEPVNQNLFGYNFGNAFFQLMLPPNVNPSNCPIQGVDPELASLFLNLNPKVIRFSGGSIANFYHPYTAGYGIKENEVKDENGDFITSEDCPGSSFQSGMEGPLNKQDCFSRNVLWEFIDMINNHYPITGQRPQVIYVANLWQHFTKDETVLPSDTLFSAMLEETQFVIQSLEDAGIHVIAVELGNELYLCNYIQTARQNYNEDWQEYAGDYLQIAHKYATELSSVFPEIQFGIPVDYTSPNSAWNDHILASLNDDRQDVDALIIHPYFDVEECRSDGGDNYTSCVKKIINEELASKFEDKIENFREFDLWATEWNFSSNMTGLILNRKNQHHTFNNNHYIFQFLHYLLQHPELNVKIATFHNVYGKYRTDYWSNDNVNGSNPANQNRFSIIGVNPTNTSQINLRMGYFTLKLLQELFNAVDGTIYPFETHNVILLDDNVSSSNANIKNVPIYVYHNTVEEKLYVYYSNSSRVPVSIDFDQISNQFMGENHLLYHFENIAVHYLVENNLIDHEPSGIFYEEVIDGQFSLAPISTGYFEIDLVECINCTPTNNPNAGYVQFDGLEQQMTINDPNRSIKFNNVAATLEAVIAPENLHNSLTDKVILSNYKNIWAFKTGFEFGITKDSEIYLRTFQTHFFNPNNIITAKSDAIDLTNGCHHIAMVRNNQGQINFYHNGEIVGSNSSWMNMNSFGTQYLIGKSAYQGSTTFKGKVDEVRIWKTDRSVNDLLLHKDLPLLGIEQDLIGYWNMDNLKNQRIGWNNGKDAILGSNENIETNKDPLWFEGDMCSINNQRNMDDDPFNLEVKTISITDEPKPLEFDFQIFPNPSNGQFNIELELSESSYVKVQLINMNGAIVKEKEEISVSEGKSNIGFSAQGLPPGIYKCVVDLGTQNKTLSIVIVQ